MATVPGCDRAIVDRTKIVDYLLSTTHPIGRMKARFFGRFGFRSNSPDEFLNALLLHVQTHAVADTETSIFGVKYRVDGPLKSPDGRDPHVSTVWTFLHGATNPRFITAFPC